jgi:hypothetical protein
VRFHAATPARINPPRRPSQLPQTMQAIEITEECRALIESALGPATGRRLPNGNWRIPINEVTWERLQQLRRQGETISDCIIRVIIVTQYRRGLR